jgi:GTPase SAR1 family protein
MGNCFGAPDDVEKENGGNMSPGRKKIILLGNAVAQSLISFSGAGDTGKSTIFRQMKFKHEGLSQFEQTKATEIIHTNILRGMCAIVRATTNLDINIEEENRERAEPFVSMNDNDIKRNWNPKIIDDMIHLWSDPGIKECIERRGEYQLDECVTYYFSRIDEIRKSDYIPTKEDMVKSRTKTTGIVECDFLLGDKKVRLVDVGGQRNERKKWVHCFTNVSMLVYVVAISEFDQLCYEDDRTNRSMESLALFKDTVNNPFFKEIPVVLLFNKNDIFEEKLKNKSIDGTFPEYNGGKEMEAAAEYIKARFLAETEKPITVLHTVATDLDALEKAFAEIQNIV